MDFTRRNRLLIGEDAQENLKHAHVRIFGCGGVGSFVIEGLIRAGVEHLSLIDFDRIEMSNLNRQLMTTQNNIGKLKVEEMKARLLSINPRAQVDIYPIFFNEESDLDFTGVDVVVDAIDSVPSKLHLMKVCEDLNLPLIMALGTARKLDPSCLKISRLYKTSIDPLARKIRILAKKAGLKDITVVYSTEDASEPIRDEALNKVVNGSMVFVPASAGLLIASRVVTYLTHGKEGNMV